MIRRRVCRSSTPSTIDVHPQESAAGLSSPLSSISSTLFCTLEIHNRFPFNRFRTLCPKHPGVGMGNDPIFPTEDQNEPNETENCFFPLIRQSLCPSHSFGTPMPSPGLEPRFRTLPAPPRRARAIAKRRRLSLSDGCQGFQTAQGINHSLHNLYWLLATNQSPPAAPPFLPTSIACSCALCRPLMPIGRKESPTPPPPPSPRQRPLINPLSTLRIAMPRSLKKSGTGTPACALPRITGHGSLFSVLRFRTAELSAHCARQARALQ